MPSRYQDEIFQCSEFRSLLDRVFSLEISTGEERGLVEHLAGCAPCAAVYAGKAIGQETTLDAGEFHLSGRPVWGTLGLNLDQVREWVDDAVQAALSLEKAGGFICIKHNASLEVPVLLLQTRLRAALRREGKRIVVVSPTTETFLMPYLSLQRNGSRSYLFVSHMTRFADFQEFLQALSKEGRIRVVVVGTVPADEWDEEVVYRSAPVIYGLESSRSAKNRFEREVHAEANNLWGQARRDLALTDVCRTVAVLDALGVPTPISFLEKIVAKSRSEIELFQAQAKGFLFWLGSVGDPHKYLCTNGEAIAEAFVKAAFKGDEPSLQKQYGAIIQAASKEERVTILKLFLGLEKRGRRLLARHLVESSREALDVLFAQSESREVVAWGKVLEKLGLYGDAEKTFARGMQADPSNMYLRHSLARLAGILGRFAEAEHGFASLQADEAVNRSPYLWQSWGDLERKRGRIPIARKRLEEALRRDPKNIPALVACAVLELEEGTLDRARYWTDEALKHDARSVYALNVRGRIEAKGRDYSMALEYWNRALLIDPFNVPTFNALAVTEKERGHLKIAKEHLEKALSIDPENLHSLVAMADLEIEVGRMTDVPEAYNSAEKALAKALELDPKNIQALVTLGVLKTEQGDFEVAERAFRAGQDIKTRSPYVETAWGDMERRRRNYAIAKNVLETVLHREPDNISALNVLARLQAGLGHLEEARRTFRISLKRDHQNIRTLNAWADIETKYGDESEAVALLDRSLALDPENAYTHRLRFRFFQKTGDSGKADLHFRKAEELGLLLGGTQAIENPWTKETHNMSGLMTVKEADELYERHGKPLEKDHHGEYAAISPDGRVILGKDDSEVVDRAIRELGQGNFVLYRVGYDYVYKIRRGRCSPATTIHISRLG